MTKLFHLNFDNETVSVWLKSFLNGKATRIDPIVSKSFARS